MELSPSHPLRRHFCGVVEDVFCTQVGLCDPQLTDYLVDLLVNFMHIDRLRAIRRVQSKRLEQIAAVLAVQSEEKPATAAQRDRVMYRCIGDFTLFWAGLYPEHLRQSDDPSDLLLNYVNRGKRSYAIVSELVADGEAPPPSLFRSLSDDFEYCLYGLGLVRSSLETRSAGDSTGELLI